MRENQIFRSKAAQYALGVYRGPLPSTPANSTNSHGLTTSNPVESTKPFSLEKAQRTCIQNLRRNWSRFWCCYLFWCMLFLAIFIPIFLIFCIPSIAQTIVNNSSLELTEAKVMQPRPSSIRLSLKSTLKLPIAILVRIEPFPLKIFNRDMPGNNTWAKVSLPETNVKGSATIGINDQLTELNIRPWMYYLHDAISEVNTMLSVKGAVVSFIGKLKARIVIDKDIKQNALNKFHGFAINNSTLILPALADGSNLVANVTLPNPSVMTLEVGTTIFDLKIGDLLIGNATIDHLVLRPGNHSSPIHGILDLRKLIRNLDVVFRSQDQYLKNGYLSLTTVGKSVVYDGVEVPYYTQILKNLTLTAQVPVGELLMNTLRHALHDSVNEPQRTFQ